MASSVGTVAVLGGGISGLAAAYRLTQIAPSPSRIVLMEASSRLGGWIRTIRNDDGIIYETGPRTLRPVGPSAVTTLNLVDQLNLSDKVMSLSKTHPSARNRLVYVNQKLVRLPMELSAIFATRPPFQRPLLMAGLQDLLSRRSNEPDESIYEFFARRLGRDLAEFAADPLIRGVCAGDCREISVRFLFKALKEYELQYGSIVVGAVAEGVRSLTKAKTQQPQLSELARRSVDEDWSVWSLHGGLETLVEKLAEAAAGAGVELLLGAPCTALEPAGAEGIVVRSGTRELIASHVVSALPASQLAALLHPTHPTLAALLHSIPSVDVGLVNMEWPGRRLASEAFGVLVPSSQPAPVLGMVFDSCSFGQGDRTIVTAMMGGRWFQTLFGDAATGEDLTRVAHQQVIEMLGIQEPPSRSQAHLQRQCIPQYVVGHSRRVDEMRRYIDDQRLPVHLVGASFDGVSVNDCIHNAIQAVDRMASV